MDSVDNQVREIHKEWDEQIPDPWVTTSTPSEVEGLDNISISFKPYEPDTETTE